MTIFLSEHDAARLGIDGAKPRRSARHARETRPDVPRAARAERGDGDRQKDLNALARAGLTCTNYLHATGEFWMSGKAGTSPRVSSYREMIETALEYIATAAHKPAGDVTEAL